MNFTVKNILIGLVFFALATSCKSKRALITKNEAVTEISTLKKIVSNYYDARKDFQTLYMKANVDYQDANRGQSVSADIRIDKDKMILLSVRFLGITVAKALITPDKVQYYEKLGSKYFEGNYSTISKWLGTDLDYMKVQNLILGMPIDNLKRNNYSVEIKDNNYSLKADDESLVRKMFTISSVNNALLYQEIAQMQKNRMITVEYGNHQEFAEGLFPQIISILATQNAQNTSVKVEITNIKFNEQMTFPYSVPNGYSKIESRIKL